MAGIALQNLYIGRSTRISRGDIVCGYTRCGNLYPERVAADVSMHGVNARAWERKVRSVKQVHDGIILTLAVG